MTNPVRLVLAIHIHQPIGNFEDVFENAYRDSYAPFLDVLQDYPEIPIVLHVSGSLLEWLEQARPDYVDRIRNLTDRGQIEILGGPFYEPILAGIPRRDRIGQIAAYSRHLEGLFGSRVRGMWVPERVWEQSFASDVAEAGIEYTVLDDFHFRNAGLRPDELHGYYITEDEGRLFKIFPGSEKLRYTIPFRDPQETIDYLRDLGDRFPNPVATFGDDGEKFGTWPETKKHVYEDRWLRRFFDALRENADWLKVVTLAEAVDNVSPLGKCYLPDASYREMTEWALPSDLQIEFDRLVERKKQESDWHELRQFLRGGFWRNFLVKYPEAGEMYARVSEISRRLEEASRDGTAEKTDLLNQARTELYRAECNCPYWHGAFGGLYLPHLRNAVYQHLIAAETLLEEATGESGRRVRIAAEDYNLDARKEIRLASDRLAAYLAPGCGGHLYELDVRAGRVNLLATLNRRPEPYHETVREAARHMQGNGHSEVASIHEAVRFKQPDLDQKLVYDGWPRKSLVDHFLQPGLDFEQFQQGGGGLGDFVTGVYESVLRKSDARVEAKMTREGQVGPYRIRVTKTVALDLQATSRLEVRYEMENLPTDVPLHFGVEFNFAGMAGGAPDRYYYDAQGSQLGTLDRVQSLDNAERLGLMDEWLGVDVSLDLSQPGGLWTFPVQTISQSESGFELVHQSAAVVPHWEFYAPEDGRWSVEINLALDTSAAQARRLSEAAATG